MRGFRIFDHTEKVGVVVGRIRPDSGGHSPSSVARQSGEGCLVETMLACDRDSFRSPPQGVSRVVIWHAI